MTDQLVYAAQLGPLRGHRLYAGAATVKKNHVAVLCMVAIEGIRDGGCVGAGLTADDVRMGSLGQVGAGLAILAGAAEAAGIDGGGGEGVGLRGARSPDVVGLERWAVVSWVRTPSCSRRSSAGAEPADARETVPVPGSRAVVRAPRPAVRQPERGECPAYEAS